MVFIFVFNQSTEYTKRPKTNSIFINVECNDTNQESTSVENEILPFTSMMRAKRMKYLLRNFI